MIYYADFVSGAAMSGGNVKLKLATRERKEGEPTTGGTTEEVGTLVMPVQGFVEFSNLVLQVMAEMEKRGMIKKGEGTPQVDKVEAKIKS